VDLWNKDIQLYHCLNSGDLVLLVMRAAPKEDSAVSSDPLVLPGQLPTAKPLPPPQRSYRDALMGGLPPSRSYEAPAAGPFRSPSGIHKAQRVRQVRWQPVVLRWAVYGAGPRREGVPAACGGQRGDDVGGPPEAAHGCRVGAAGGTAKERSAAGVGCLIHRCRLRTSALRGVLWRTGTS
jgi:hypothetical protein